MRFAIRDDDTNFFTTPAQLEACYRNIWDFCPPTLCLISKVKGNWEKWVHQIYQTKQQTDWIAWDADNTVYPIEQNTELVDFLKHKLTEQKLDIAFHAKHHRNGDDTLPADKENNYVRGAEFYTSRDLTSYIKDEIIHLQNIFNNPISVFTPPQNLLTEIGYRSVINAGLNLCGGGITFYKKEKDAQGIINIAKQMSFKMLHKGNNYPYVLNYSNHTEIPYHYPLQPDTQLQTLINAFETVRKYDGDFVLSTHYVEFDYKMTYDQNLTMKHALEQFIDYISKYSLQTMSLSKLLTKA